MNEMDQLIKDYGVLKRNWDARRKNGKDGRSNFEIPINEKTTNK